MCAEKGSEEKTANILFFEAKRKVLLFAQSLTVAHHSNKSKHKIHRDMAKERTETATTKKKKYDRICEADETRECRKRRLARWHSERQQKLLNSKRNTYVHKTEQQTPCPDGLVD